MAPTTEKPDQRDVLGVLQQARVYVSSGWTQGMYVQKRDGDEDVSLEDVFENRVPVRNVCLCASGALRLAIGRKFGRLNGVGTGALYSACALALTDTHACGTLSYITLNDRPDTKQADVLRMFDEAISTLEGGDPQSAG